MKPLKIGGADLNRGVLIGSGSLSHFPDPDPYRNYVDPQHCALDSLGNENKSVKVWIEDRERGNMFGQYYRTLRTVPK